MVSMRYARAGDMGALTYSLIELFDAFYGSIVQSIYDIWIYLGGGCLILWAIKDFFVNENFEAFIDDLPFPVAVRAPASTRLLFALIPSIPARFPLVRFERLICAPIFRRFILQFAAFALFAFSSLGFCSCESLDFSLYADLHSVRASSFFDAIWILLTWECSYLQISTVSSSNSSPIACALCPRM